MYVAWSYSHTLLFRALCREPQKRAWRPECLLYLAGSEPQTHGALSLVCLRVFRGRGGRLSPVEHVVDGVLRFAVDPDLVVQVRPRASARGANLRDDIAPLEPVAALPS